ncbi:MAG: glycosyltransferase [Kiritimatiellae bacterium]|nr:glycosyltransferase [Kiritimatiellia bacterium]
MPVFNGARHLSAALHSLAPAAGEPMEIIAVEDGSTDDSPRLLDEWSRRLPLRVVSGPRSGNWVAATQRGLELARGEWVSFLHQDDAWAPGRLSALRQAAARHSAAGWIVHAARFVDDAGRPLGRWRCPFPADRPLSAPGSLRRLAMQNPIPLPGVCARRTLLEQVGPMDDTLWYLADWDLWIRLAAAAPMVYLDAPLADFRIHPASQSSVRTRDADDVERQFLRVQSRLRELAPTSGVSAAWLDRVAPLSRAAYRCLLALAHRQRVPWARLLTTAAHAGPLNCARYIVWSRVFDRALARRRARATPASHEGAV